MKEKRTIYLVEDSNNYTFTAFDTLAEAKMHILHEYLDRLESTGFDPEKDMSSWLFKDLRSIDEQAYVEDLFCVHQAEYAAGDQKKI